MNPPKTKGIVTFYSQDNTYKKESDSSLAAYYKYGRELFFL